MARWECERKGNAKKGVEVLISNWVASIVVMIKFPGVLGIALFLSSTVS